MAGTFLSYRRDDAAGWAGRLYEYLVREWGPDEVFMDIDAIAPGEDFRKAITSTMEVSDTVLVVIGPTWVDARDEAGRRRLDDERDTHRTEVVAALEAPDVRVIPVLVGGAAMPAAPELPEPLQELAYRNAAVIDDRRFPADVGRLIDAVKESRDPTTRWAAPDTVHSPSSSPKPWRRATRPKAAAPTNSASRQPATGRRPPSRQDHLTIPASLLTMAGLAIVLVWGALVPRSWHNELLGIRIGAAFVLVGIVAWGLASKSWKLVNAGGVAGLVGLLLWMVQLLLTGHTAYDVLSPATDGVPNILALVGAVVVLVGAYYGRRASERGQ